MRHVVLCACFLALACGTDTGVQAINQDTFRIFKQGSTGFVGSDKVKSDVMLEASQYCAQKGKIMQVVSVVTGQPPYILGNFPKAEVQFRCIDPSVTKLTGSPSEPAENQPAAPGEVAISSNIPNAEVSVDGKFVGNAPLSALRLAGGTHTIEVTAKGYSSWKRELTVIPGASTRVVAELEQLQKP